MKKAQKPLIKNISAAVLAVIAANGAYAGSFSLYTESSPAALGNYAAGVAAEARDASTGWYNPAGLALLHDQQLVLGGAGVFPSSKLNGSSTFFVEGLPNYPEAFNGINGAESAFVPSLHYARPVSDKLTFGFSIVSPYGLSTDWGVDSPVRYQATKSELVTVNFSPELGAKITDTFSVGAGLDLQYAQVKFNRIVGIPNIADFLYNQPARFDSLSYNKGNSFGVGYHVGLMGVFNDNHTRLGINYQSAMRHTFNGYSQLSGPLAGMDNIFNNIIINGVARNNNLSSDPIQLPGILTLSAYHDVNQALALLGSVVYTNWNLFKTIQLNNVKAPSVAPLGGGNPGEITLVSLNVNSPQYYRSAWRAALGANYRFNEQWMLRVGGGYDQTPTNNTYRDVRLPDVDRWALSIGGHYQAKPSVGIDVGYTHLFPAKTIAINRTDELTTTSSYNVTATGGSVNADLVGAQVVWTIDQPKNFSK